MKWNATIIVIFFLSTRTDQNSSWKFYKIWCQIAPFGLTNWTKMVLPVFPRNIPYRARPKSPPFQFFSALREIFSEFFSPKGPPCFFLMFCDRMDVGKSQRVPPFSFFRHCEIFSRKWKKNSSIFSCFATKWMKNLEGSPFQFFGIVRLKRARGSR